MSGISLTIIKRQEEDRYYLSKVLFLVNQDDWARKFQVSAQKYFFVIPVEGVDAVPMTSAFRNPAVTVNEVKLSGPAFVVTNNEEMRRFPFSMRAFRGLLFIQIPNEQGNAFYQQTAIKVRMTFEDVEGSVKYCGPVDVQNGQGNSLDVFRQNLMPW